jgi:hypothetical protein
MLGRGAKKEKPFPGGKGFQGITDGAAIQDGPRSTRCSRERFGSGELVLPVVFALPLPCEGINCPFHRSALALLGLP